MVKYTTEQRPPLYTDHVMWSFIWDILQWQIEKLSREGNGDNIRHMGVSSRMVRDGFGVFGSNRNNISRFLQIQHYLALITDRVPFIHTAFQAYNDCVIDSEQGGKVWFPLLEVDITAKLASLGSIDNLIEMASHTA